MRCGCVQVLLQEGKKLTYDQPNPFVGEGNEELAAVAYRSAPTPDMIPLSFNYRSLVYQSSLLCLRQI